MDFNSYLMLNKENNILIFQIGLILYLNKATGKKYGENKDCVKLKWNHVNKLNKIQSKINLFRYNQISQKKPLNQKKLQNQKKPLNQKKLLNQKNRLMKLKK